MSDIVERTEKTERSDSGRYNAGTVQNQLIHEYVNSAYNHHIIIKAIKDGRARDIADEPRVSDIPAIIIGSGPSLDYSIKYLKDWKGGIICSTSHALTLMYYGIEPTHIVALDPFSTYEEIEGIDWSKTRTKLVAHPGVWPSLIEKWPNEILLYLENLGKPDSFYADIEKKMYSWREEQGLGQRKPKFNFYIRTEIILFAASPPLQLFVADLLGYGPFFTAGVDFGYSHNKSRFTGYTINENTWSYDKIVSEGERIKNELSDNKEIDTKLFWNRFNNAFQNSTIKEIEWVKHESPLVKNDTMIMSNNGILTEDIHLYYKKNYLSAWRLLGKTMYSTDQGIVPEIPYIDIHKVVRNQGYGFPMQTPEMIADIVETYLAGVGAFIVDSGQGIGFIECANPEVDLMAYMSEILNLYKCGNCNATVKSSTTKSDLEKELVECPQCKEKKLVHINKTLNVEANVKRIHKRLMDSGIEVKPENWVLT